MHRFSGTHRKKGNPTPAPQAGTTKPSASSSSLKTYVKADALRSVKHYGTIGIAVLGISGFVALISVLCWRRIARRRSAQQAARADNLILQSQLNLQQNVWDVIIVGAGPAGSTCAFYLAKSQLRVLLLDRDRFPRDKICGDQIHSQAQEILRDMGVLQQLVNDNAVRWAVNRGVVSPAGFSFVGEIKEKDGLMSVQRVVLDEKLVLAAQKSGAVVMDSTSVQSAVYDRPAGIWCLEVTEPNVPLSDRASPDRKHTAKLSCRVLVCADGAYSTLARSLQGLTLSESPAVGLPNAVGGRAFAQRHTHDCRADEVIFYSSRLLPGHLRFSGELDDFMNISCFVLPHPDSGHASILQAFPEKLQEQFQHVTEEEPWVRQALGPRCKLSQLQTAPLRVGGVSRSYFPNGIIIGDAAGQQDPLTGDGLQYGMRSAKLAAEAIVSAYQRNDFSMAAFRIYHEMWRSLFGWDFFWAKGIVYLMAKIPRLIDAVTIVIQRKGVQAILFWALARSGSKSKLDVILWFLRPDIFWQILYRWLSLWAQQEF